MSLNHNKRIISNTLILMTRTFFVTLVSLITVSELLKVLGVNDFGLFNLIFGIAIMFSFINGAMSVAVQRYLGKKIGEKDGSGVVRVFYVSLIIHFLIAILIVFLMLLSKDFLIINILNINNSYYSVDFLYYLAISNIFILCIQSPFVALISIYEKMSFLAFVSVFEALLKLIFVYMLFLFPDNQLIAYAILLNVASYLIFALYLTYYLILFGRDFNKKYSLDLNAIKDFKEISSFMGWTIFGNFAWMSRVHGMNVLLNIFFGVAANAAYAISNTIFNTINNLLNSISNAIKPQIFISYSAGEYSRFNTLIFTGTKFFSTGLAAVAIPIILFTNEILFIWLESIPENTVIFVKLTLVLLYVESLSVFLTLAIQAIGKIKIYQIYMSLLILSSIPIAYFSYKKGFNIELFIYILALNSILCFLSRLFFLKIHFNFDVFSFLRKSVFNGVFVVLLMILLDSILFELLFEENLNVFYLIFSLFLIFTFNMTLMYLISANYEQKKLINSFFKLTR